MALYVYQCGKCGSKAEVIQNGYKGIPLCCGVPMKQLPTYPALITMVGKGKIPTRSKGYKEGYSREYLKSIGKES